MDWFLYDRDLCHERVKNCSYNNCKCSSKRKPKYWVLQKLTHQKIFIQYSMIHFVPFFLFISMFFSILQRFLLLKNWIKLVPTTLRCLEKWYESFLEELLFFEVLQKTLKNCFFFSFILIISYRLIWNKKSNWLWDLCGKRESMHVFEYVTLILWTHDTNLKTSASKITLYVRTFHQILYLSF